MAQRAQRGCPPGFAPCGRLPRRGGTCWSLSVPRAALLNSDLAAQRDHAAGHEEAGASGRDSGSSSSPYERAEGTPGALALRASTHRLTGELVAAGRLGDAQRLLVEYNLLTDGVLEDPALAQALVVGLVESSGCAAGLATLPLVLPSAQLAAAALRACAARRSVRGVSEVMAFSHQAGLLQGPKSQPLWLEAVRAYGALGRLDDARRVFKDMRAEGAWSLADTRGANVLLNALHSDVRLAFVRARQLLDEGLAPDTWTLNALLKACQRAKDARRADLACRWMDAAGVAPDETSFNTLVKVFSYAGEFERALAVRERMVAAGLPPSPAVWGSLLVACGAAGQVETALMLWREMKAAAAAAGGRLSVDNYHAMMTACNSCYQGERALGVFEEMRCAALPLDARSFNIALKACEAPPGKALRQEQFMTALALRHDMRAAGVAPDAYTFGTLMDLCAQARQGHTALALFEEDMPAAGVAANVVIATSLIRALGGAGMVDECLAVFSRMVWGPKRLKPNRAAFKALITVLREGGALGAALRVYDGMRRAGHAPNNREFQELTAAAAEVALTKQDSDLQAQVASVCNVTSCREVDLHGMSLYEARAAVLCMLSLLQQTYRARGCLTHDITIITGRGEHSAGGEPVLRGTILGLLRDELHLRALPPEEGNPGRVVVPREAAEAWLRACCASRQTVPGGA